VPGALLAVSGLLSCSRNTAPTALTSIRVEVVQTTTDLADHLSPLQSVSFHAGRPPGGVPIIHVDDTVTYQRVIGVGAAMTDTSAWLLHDELPPDVRASVMRNLFGSGGIDLEVVRVPMAASDFTKNGVPYSYDDQPSGESDPSLARFSVAHDAAYVLPVLREVLAINPRVEVLATPWSPPGWMKTNDALSNPGGAGRLLPAAYGLLADYFVKFIQAYAREGVRIDAIAPQNEPGQTAMYPSLNLSETEEAKFISNDLAPALAAAGLRPRIYGDDWKWLLWQRAFALAANPAVAKVLSGIAWHCYSGNPVVMTTLHRLDRALDQIESECSSGGAPGPPGELMIASFRNWASSVLLWNVALDPSGGPVQPPNYGCPRCTGVITIDERRHTVRYERDYYVLGQFGKFVETGARRIGSDHFVAYNTPTRYRRINYATAGIDDVAFRNPDGRLVLLVQNNASGSRRFAVAWHRGVFMYSLPAGATVTFEWPEPAGATTVPRPG
jgi:glucosylceramidase